MLALRPEGTASAVRSYLQHNSGAEDAVTRWFYVGPMFRHERPQKGRYRQFQQVGAELFGAANPEADAEMIAMVRDWLAALGLGGVELQINSIGDSVCRPGYLETLRVFLRAHAAELCEDCRRRTETNPLRTLDCKNPACQKVLAAAPTPVDSLCDPCRAHFTAVRGFLGKLAIGHRVNPRLVRGLDYYTRTTFEFTAEAGLGTQNTVAAGGRYDGLVEALGGPAVPAVGFAAGVERLVLAMGEDSHPPSGPDLFVASHGEAERGEALALAASARAAGLRAEIDPRGGSLKSQLRRADRLGATIVVVLGEDEIRSGRVKLKQMGIAGSLGSGQSQEVGLAEAVLEVRKVLGMPKGGG
jgi:histidyl-tRNA synthetase